LAGRVFVVSGPSGAGKGTVVQAALAKRPDIFLSVSLTTRPARAGEREGKDYYFVSAAEFRAMVSRGELLEWAEVYGDLKGTPRRPVEEAVAADRDVLLEVDIQGAQAIKRSLPEAILIFIEPPSLVDLALRLRGRGTETTASLSKRMRAAYEEVRRKGIFDHIVVNDDAERAADELLRIIESQ
jgi:guanylate kinase